MFCHIDADAFFASVLQRKHPRLTGKPLLALGMGGGCVIAASYEAKACGVKTGMRLSEARKLCPKAIAMPSDFDEALLASRQIEQILQNRCPILERYSVDEWFLDVRALPGGIPKNIIEWANALKNTIHQSVGLTVSIGVGPSKLLAKMASEYKKPSGVTFVFPSSVKEGASGEGLSIDSFLQSRTADAIPGIGRRRSLHAEAHDWRTAWDIANANQETIQKLFGRPGLAMQRELLGECIEPIQTTHVPPKSISRTRSFPPSINREMVYAHLLHHLTYTMLKMRREGLACKAISVWIRSNEYTFEQKVHKLSQAADTEEHVLPYVHQCFQSLFVYGKSYTQIGLGLLALNPKGGTQYSLFEDITQTNEVQSIQKAMDDIHAQYGREALKRGSAMAVIGSQKKHVNAIDMH